MRFGNSRKLITNHGEFFGKFSGFSCYFFFTLILCVNTCSETFGLNSNDNPDSIKNKFPPEGPMVYEGIVKSSGFDPNNIEDIKRAAMEDFNRPARTNTYILRDAAITLLVYKIDKESISELKKSLNDSFPYVRSTAAGYLGLLGDKSGLEIMRKDMEELTKDNAEFEKTYYKSYPSQKTMPLTLKTKGNRTLMALKAAQVLAENGDISCYKFALQKAVVERSGYRRDQAVRVLTALALALDHKETFDPNSGFPEVIILDAEKEKNPLIIDQIIGFARTFRKHDSGSQLLPPGRR